MAEDRLLENRDFLDLWEEKFFLGHEFMTWLWLTTERDNRLLDLDKVGTVEIWFENRLQLENGQGANRQSVACQSPGQATGPEWAEAYAALTLNKKVVKGRLKVRSGDREWALTLVSDTLNPQGIKLTSTQESGEDDELGQAGAFLERISLTMELLSILDAVLARFLKLRLSSDWLNMELPLLQKWIKRRNEENFAL